VTSAQTIPAPGEAVLVEPEFEDYFGFSEVREFVLPDGKQKIFFKVMNEGDKAKFQKETNRDIHLNRTTNDARIKTDPAGERHALIHTCVTGWTLKKKNPTSGQWEDAPYGNNGTPGDLLGQWMSNANPRLVEALEDAIRKANPWLLGEMTVEQIDEEMQRLADLKVEIQKRQASEATFQG
jgi:hypothetical protein